MSEPESPAPHGPDRPRVPRLGMRPIVKLYAAGALLTSAGLLASQLLGLTFSDASERDNVPASVRTSPGGYRSYHFWHSGYQGGK